MKPIDVKKKLSAAIDGVAGNFQDYCVLVGGKNVEEGDGTFEFFVFVSSNGHSEMEKTNRTVTEGVFFDNKDGLFSISIEEFIEAPIKGEQMPPHSQPENWNVGVRYGNKIRLYKKENNITDDSEESVEHGHHRPPRPHMRRAHWQYYWTGPGRTVQKHVWIEPILVNGTNDEMPITMIDVTDKESRGYDGEQHFSPVEQWGGEEAYQKQRKADKEKNEWCEKNKIPLLRIRYDQKPLINELVEAFLKNPQAYITEHNGLLSNEEYYSICK